MAYPGSLDSFTANVDTVDDVLAADVNELQTALVAIETELGTDPAGTLTDVATRLLKSLSTGGLLKFATSTELTIASGAITVTQNFHTIDTESDTSSDNLDTISGGGAGQWAVFRANHTDRSIVFKHGTGNILCLSSSDITLDDTTKFVIGIYDGDLTKWLIAIPYGTGATTFLGLTDTPASFAGNALKLCRVNTGETALEFTSPGAGSSNYSICNGRLTLTTAVPVTTADVSNATTLYFTPYKGNLIGLYDGSAEWTVVEFAELSLDISAYTASKPYDIWVYNNSGTTTLDSTVWTNATTRATALTTQDGIYVKTGATTRRYVGTICISADTGEIEDTVVWRGLWNYYNRCKRQFYKADTVNSHNYALTTHRYFNADATSIIKFILGVLEEPITIGLSCQIVSGDGSDIAYMGIGYDSATTPANDFSLTYSQLIGMIRSFIKTEDLPEIGYHFYSAAEWTDEGTCTFVEYVIDGYILG